MHLSFLSKVVCTYILGSSVHNACVLHFYIHFCPAQLSMSYVEKHCRNKIIIYVYGHVFVCVCVCVYIYR